MTTITTATTIIIIIKMKLLKVMDFLNKYLQYLIRINILS